MRDGILMGYLKHGEDCAGHEVAIAGSPTDLLAVVHLLGLIPDGEPDKTGAITLHDEARTSLVTMRPTQRASDILGAAISQMEPPF